MNKPAAHEESKNPVSRDGTDPGTGSGGGTKSGYDVVDIEARDESTDPGTGSGGGPKSGYDVEDDS